VISQIKHLIWFFCLCILAGCSTSPVLTKEDFSNFTVEKTQLSFDNPQPMFKTLFPSGLPLKKDPLETQAEYRARLSALNYEGQEFTFLIPPELCKIQPFPEQGFYVITSKDTFPMGYDSKKKPYGISIARVDESSSRYVGQNAFGATAEIRSYIWTDLQIAPVDFFELPRILRWTDGEGSVFGMFGLPILNTDPIFRQKLKQDKIGLAVRIRVADLTRMDYDSQSMSPTIKNPVAIGNIKPRLPVFMLDAWIVDTDTNTSLVHWRNDKG